MDDIRYNECLEKFWIAMRDPEEQGDISYWDLGLEEQEKVRLAMEKELREEEAYYQQIGEYCYNQYM